jgi:hypothetical protein
MIVPSSSQREKCNPTTYGEPEILVEKPNYHRIERIGIKTFGNPWDIYNPPLKFCLLCIFL